MRLLQFLGAALLCTSLAFTACLEQEKDVVDECVSLEACSDAQWDQLFDQAVSALEAEGHAMTHETLNEQDVYWMLFDRMVSLVKDRSETAQLSSYVWASYDSTVEYCGPGHTEAGGSVFFPLPDDCLNRACYTHDCCYDSIEEGRSRLCGWSAGTKYCDDEFFSSYEQCKEAGECGVKCRIIGGIARGLTKLPRTESCSECTSLSNVEACSSLGAECGETINGCGDTIACGSCTSPQTCGHTVPNRCGPKLSGDPCEDGVDCSAPDSICWNETCLQEGQLRITLGWTVDTDFDLHVLTPSGSEISWSQESADGGVLDIDDCYDECKNSSGTHVENVFFEAAPPNGSYKVWVENYDGRDGGSFEIEVAGPKAGDAAQTFSGSLPATGDASSMRFSFTIE